MSGEPWSMFAGDGSDGDIRVECDGTFTSLRDMQISALYIGARGCVKPNGFRLFIIGDMTTDDGYFLHFSGGGITSVRVSK